MRLTPSLLAVALALTTAGCAGQGGGPGPTAAQSRPAQSGATGASGEGGHPAAANGDDSAAPTDTGTPFDPHEFTRRLEAAVEKSPTVRIDMELQVDGQVTAGAQGVQDLGTNSLDMDVTAGGREIGYRLVDGRYYLARPPQWVPVSPESQDPLARQALQQIQVLSLRNLLDALAAGLESAGVKGSTDVRGIATTHYRAAVDSTEAFAELGLDLAEGTQQSINCDLWVDEDDLVRKLRFTQNGTTTTITASNWGLPVTITRPATSQLAEPGSGTPRPDRPRVRDNP